MTRTLLKAEWIVGYKEGSHRVLRDGVVVSEDDRIVFVGPESEAPTFDVRQDYGPGSVITLSLIHI